MIVLTGGDIVLPDRVLAGGSLLIDGDGIVGIEPRPVAPAGADVRAVAGSIIVPGFIDVHVHGVAGTDVLDDEDAVARVARTLPRFGVTAFCPTSVACDPATLARFLRSVAQARAAGDPESAAVLPAHLESNFISPDWKGAQPAECLRRYRPAGDAPIAGAFTGDDILNVLAAQRAQVGIVTIAPELDGGLDLVGVLRDAGHIVSIGHSGATHEAARAAIRAGITHATHLFNRMTPLGHREPGVVGAVLESSAVTAEIICDGVHVHPAVVEIAIRAKTAARVMAITDGTAAAGLPPGTPARLGGRRIIAGPHTATLDDGTLAGSVATMDVVFRMLVRRLAVPMPVAAQLCSATAARQLSLAGRGRIEAGQRADLVVLGPGLDVRETWIAGRRVKEH